MPLLLSELLAVSDSSVLSILREAWAYTMLGGSALLTEELAPLIGGFAAERGHLGFVRVVAACAVGVWSGTALLYALGRWRAAWVRLKLRRSPPVVKKLLRAMRWSPWSSTMISRFIPGGRIAVPLACGAAHVPIWIFLTGSAIAAVAWSVLFVSLGWFFGDGAMLVVGQVRRYEDALAVVLVALAVGVFVWIRRRQKRAQALAPDTGAYAAFEEREPKA